MRFFSKPPAPERDFFGVTPLHLAVRKGNLESLRVLLAAGADPNVTDITGRSVLMDAFEDDNPAAVRDLILAGADPTLTAGRTMHHDPLDYAYRQNRYECLLALVEALPAPVPFPQKNNWKNLARYFFAREMARRRRPLWVTRPELMKTLSLAFADCGEECDPTLEKAFVTALQCGANPAGISPFTISPELHFLRLHLTGSAVPNPDWPHIGVVLSCIQRSGRWWRRHLGDFVPHHAAILQNPEVPAKLRQDLQVCVI